MGSQIDFIKKGEGGAQPNISREKLVSHLMPIPPLTEQYRIVEKIQYLLPLVEKYSDSQILQDKLNAEIKDKLRKSILQEAIQGKLVLQIAEEGSAQELLERIKEEKRKLVKEGKLRKSALNDAAIFRGDDIALLADLMGHESIETTRIYLRRSSLEQQEIVDKVITW